MSDERTSNTQVKVFLADNERIWVNLEAITGLHGVGVVDNVPFHQEHGVHFGDTIQFERKKRSAPWRLISVVAREYDTHAMVSYLVGNTDADTEMIYQGLVAHLVAGGDIIEGAQDGLALVASRKPIDELKKRLKQWYGFIQVSGRTIPLEVTSN